MKTFAFKFEPVLKLRRYRRDVCRQLLAQVLADDAQLVSQRQRLEFARERQLDELRALSEGGVVDISGAAARRYHSGQLAGEIRAVEYRREVVAQQIALCRQALVRADQDVKALEKIGEKQRREYEDEQDRLGARELEDVWSSARSAEIRR